MSSAEPAPGASAASSRTSEASPGGPTSEASQGSPTSEAPQGSAARWRLTCDACGAGGAIGPREDGACDAWCEACQRGQVVPRVPSEVTPACERCGGPLSLDAPRFLEAFGAVQDLAAVVAAWRGDAAPLKALLPERPRFLTDLTPPAPASDDAPEVKDGLAALRAGHAAAALPVLVAWSSRHTDRAHLWEARAIAEERLGDPATAEESWSRAVAATGGSRTRLARGVLRARRADFDGAREDFHRAGDSREARWNRAALSIVEAVAITPGLPSESLIEAARREAGEASSYWSDPTIGRLMWSLLVERAEARRRAGASECPDERVLRAAAGLFEHDTFWDRAMVLSGYAALGMRADATAIAAPLAVERARPFAAEPFLRARGAEAIRGAAEEVLGAVERGDADQTAAALAPLTARDDLRQYAVPCAACGRGLVRADAIEETEEATRP